MVSSHNRSSGGLYLESTRAEQLGVLPGEDRLARDVMSRRVVTVDPSASLREAAETMHRQQVSSLVVCNHAGLRGLLTERDVAMNAAREGRPRTIKVEEVLMHETMSCRDVDILADALSLMKKHQLTALPVLNETGTVVGVLSLLKAAAAVTPNAATTWLDGMKTKG